MGARDILNKLRWHPKHDLDKAKITITHRGAPKDKLTISGEKIHDLGSGFMKVERKNKKVEIPYHRIIKIETPEKVMWKENR